MIVGGNVLGGITRTLTVGSRDCHLVFRRPPPAPTARFATGREVTIFLGEIRGDAGVAEGR
jgi:hypothetical protein